MKEIERIIEKYLKNGGEGIVYFNLNQELFNKVIYNAKPYERPDILSIFDNKIIGIEHFEFDSYKRTKRKGSDFKIKENKIERNINRKLNEELILKDSAIVNEEIESTGSLKNYFDNFKEIFLDHYQKIDTYIENIKNNFDCTNKEIHFCFFAEDVTTLGNYYLSTERKVSLLDPLFSSDVIEILKNSPKVEYLIIGVYAMHEYKMVIIENKKNILERLKKERMEVNEKNFLCFSPQIMGSAIKIPKNNK